MEGAGYVQLSTCKQAGLLMVESMFLLGVRLQLVVAMLSLHHLRLQLYLGLINLSDLQQAACVW